MESVSAIRQRGYQYLIVGVIENDTDNMAMDFLSAGADMIIMKPMNVKLLKLLYGYIQKYGAVTRPKMTLSVDGDPPTLKWVRLYS